MVMRRSPESTELQKALRRACFGSYAYSANTEYRDDGAEEDGMGEAGAGEIQVQRVQRDKMVAQVPVTNPQRKIKARREAEGWMQ